VLGAVNFQSPLFLLALLLVPAVLLFAWVVDRRRARFPVAFTNVELLAGLVEERRSWRRLLPLLLFVLALALAATALARPRTHLTVPEDNATVVLLVDVSGSMRANDVEPTRLDAAISAMRTFLDRLPTRFKVGLVAFSSESEILSQPTRDRDLVRDSLSYLQPEAGTAIGDGLDMATKLALSSLRNDGVKREGNKPVPAAVVLLSDGAQNRGRLQPSQSAQRARTAGIRVYTVALGTPEGTIQGPDGYGGFRTIRVPPDPVTLKQVAEDTGGRFFEAADAGALKSVYDEIGSQVGVQHKHRELTALFTAAGAALLLAGAALSMLWFARMP
jgi:Ca-activated chloride channel family protein